MTDEQEIRIALQRVVAEALQEWVSSFELAGFDVASTVADHVADEVVSRFLVLSCRCCHRRRPSRQNCTTWQPLADDETLIGVVPERMARGWRLSLQRRGEVGRCADCGGSSPPSWRA